MTTRQYSSRSQQSTLTSAITAGATSITVVSGSTLLGGVTIPAGRTFTLVIDPDTALEEIVDATANPSSNTFTIVRSIDTTGGAQAHSAGAVVRHMAIGRDFRDANLHAEASAYYNDGSGTGHTMHGIGSGEGDVVGTDKPQTLTQKTLTSPTISNPTFTGTSTVGAVLHFEGTTSDDYETILTVIDPTQDNTITLPNTGGIVILDTASQTLTNKTLTSPIISGSPTITGLSSVGMVTSSATPKSYVDSILGSAQSAETSAASAATSAASAATSASSAATSASNALTSANSASTSATAAATSATSAAASATAAATSATSAAASATTAANSATAAATSATSAATSASSALTSANSASTSAASALTSANSAATSASTMAASVAAAATSAASAATSASSAATSASSALTSANSAATSAASAAAAVAASFDAKGDLLVGTANDAFSPLTVSTTNGYILAVNSATATGLEWQAAPAGYTAPTIGTTVITSGTTVSTITAVTLDNATLSGTLTAGATSGTNGQYLKTTGTGVEWGTVQAGSQVKINGGAASTYDYIDFVGMGTDTATTGTVKVSPITVTDADPGKRVFVGTTTPTSPSTGDVWIDESNSEVDLTTMVIMGAY
jgi:hypothetical protein